MAGRACRHVEGVEGSCPTESDGVVVDNWDIQEGDHVRVFVAWTMYAGMLWCCCICVGINRTETGRVECGCGGWDEKK